MAKRKYTGGTADVPLLVDDNDSSDVEGLSRMDEIGVTKKKRKNNRGKSD